MLIVRHNSLVPPYHDYAALDAATLDLLATGAVSPSIAPLPASIAGEDELRAAMEAAEVFVCSSAVRTAETCRALMARFGITRDIRIDKNLDEISFTPSKMLKSPDENPLQAARDRLYADMAAGSPAVEAASAVETRLSAVLRDYGAGDCVVFSHGFFIRLMAAVAACGDFTRGLSSAPTAGHVDYLGFRRF